MPVEYVRGAPPIASGTIVARLMNERHVRMWELASLLECSHKSLYNYLARVHKFPKKKTDALCDFFDLDPDEILELDTGYLKRA